MSRLPDPAFWAGQRVLLTGHTGFKGSWAALWLARMGAKVTGYALDPEGDRSHFDLAGIAPLIDDRRGDLCDAGALGAAVRAARPTVVLHMAAQALVRRALRDPVTTWTSNVAGTLSLIEALRRDAAQAAVLVITSDKVYRNDDSGRAFREADPLGGKDPYSASKAACEILVASHRTSYGQRLATARGGNVVGGGDFAEDRILPDILRAAEAGGVVTLRHPEATRPWQHVLDCLCGYFLYAEALAQGAEVPPALNFGPEPGAGITVAEAAEVVAPRLGQSAAWVHAPVPGSVEARALALDAGLARARLGWRDRLPGRAALVAAADWYGALRAGADMAAVSRAALGQYLDTP